MLFLPDSSTQRFAVLVYSTLLFHVSALAQVTPTDSPTTASLWGKCESLLASKQYEDAEKCGLERLHGTYPRPWRIYKFLGQAAAGEHHLEQASEYLRKSIAQAPASEAVSLRALLKQTEASGASTNSGGQREGTASAAARPDGTAQPTLKETTDWLATKLDPTYDINRKKVENFSGVGWTETDTTFESWGRSVSPLTFDGCMGSLQVTTSDGTNKERQVAYSGDTGYELHNEVRSGSSSGLLTFSFADLPLPVRTSVFSADASVTYTRGTPKLFVTVPTHGIVRGKSTYKDNLVDGTKYHTARSLQLPDQEIEFEMKEVTFYFYDEELAERVKRALQHAGELCGAKKEPF